MTELAGLGWADTEVSFEVERFGWKELLHPRDPHGEWTNKGGTPGGDLRGQPPPGPAGLTAERDADNRRRAADVRDMARSVEITEDVEANKRLPWGVHGTHPVATVMNLAADAMEHGDHKMALTHLRQAQSDIKTAGIKLGGSSVWDGKRTTLDKRLHKVLADNIAHLETVSTHVPDYPEIAGMEAAMGIARFDPREARGFHGRWITVGSSDFAYEGPPGGGGHVRAIMSVADVIGRETNGGDTATAVRNSAKAMYARDMPSAQRHLDSAVYLDGVSGGPSHRDDIEAIRRSYAEVPAGVSMEPRQPAVPPELSIHQGRLKGRPVPAGVTGSYTAERAWWNPRLHPHDPKTGQWATSKARDIEALGRELHQDQMAEAMMAGTFKLDSKSPYHKVHHHLMAAAKALRDGDVETARHHLEKAKEHLVKLPGKASKKHAPTIDKRLAELGKALTTGKAPKRRVPVLSPQQTAMAGLMAMGGQRAFGLAELGGMWSRDGLAERLAAYRGEVFPKG